MHKDYGHRGLLHPEDLVLKKTEGMNAFVLWGGKSKRMRREKAFLRFKGRYLVDRVIECTADLFSKVYLVGRSYQHSLLSACSPDDEPHKGPLGGIATALRITDTEYNFIVGIDYPFIDPEVVIRLAEITLDRAPTYQGCIPVTSDGLHPVFAFYARTCLPAVKRCISEKNYKVSCIANYSKIWLARLPGEMSCLSARRIEKNFVNINSYEDYVTHLKRRKK